MAQKDKKPVKKKAPAKKRPAAKKKASPTKRPEKKDLYKDLSRDNPKHAKVFRFIDEYCIDMNGTQAAIRAGYAESSARTKGSELLANANVKKLIDEKLEEIAARNAVDQDKVLQHWKTVYGADRRKLTKFEYYCCRYCHGDGFLYQYTPAEMKKAEKKHNENEERKELEISGYEAKPFDEQGGDGFRRNALPNPECPECCGVGVPQLIIADSSQFDEETLELFGGFKQTRDGIEVLMIPKEKALEAMSRYVGLYERDNTVNVTDYDPEELERKYAKKMYAARMKQAAIDKERESLKDE